MKFDYHSMEYIRDGKSDYVIWSGASSLSPQIKYNTSFSKYLTKWKENDNIFIGTSAILLDSQNVEQLGVKVKLLILSYLDDPQLKYKIKIEDPNLVLVPSANKAIIQKIKSTFPNGDFLSIQYIPDSILVTQLGFQYSDVSDVITSEMIKTEVLLKTQDEIITTMRVDSNIVRVRPSDHYDYSGWLTDWDEVVTVSNGTVQNLNYQLSGEILPYWSARQVPNIVSVGTTSGSAQGTKTLWTQVPDEYYEKVVRPTILAGDTFMDYPEAFANNEFSEYLNKHYKTKIDLGGVKQIVLPNGTVLQYLPLPVQPKTIEDDVHHSQSFHFDTIVKVPLPNKLQYKQGDTKSDAYNIVSQGTTKQSNDSGLIDTPPVPTYALMYVEGFGIDAFVLIRNQTAVESYKRSIKRQIANGSTAPIVVHSVINNLDKHTIDQLTQAYLNIEKQLYDDLNIDAILEIYHDNKIEDITNYIHTKILKRLDAIKDFAQFAIENKQMALKCIQKWVDDDVPLEVLSSYSSYSISELPLIKDTELVNVIYNQYIVDYYKSLVNYAEMADITELNQVLKSSTPLQDIINYITSLLEGECKYYQLIGSDITQVLVSQSVTQTASVYGSVVNSFMNIFNQIKDNLQAISDITDPQQIMSITKSVYQLFSTHVATINEKFDLTTYTTQVFDNLLEYYAIGNTMNVLNETPSLIGKYKFSLKDHSQFYKSLGYAALTTAVQRLAMIHVNLNGVIQYLSQLKPYDILNDWDQTTDVITTTATMVSTAAEILQQYNSEIQKVFFTITSTSKEMLSDMKTSVNDKIVKSEELMNHLKQKLTDTYGNIRDFNLLDISNLSIVIPVIRLTGVLLKSTFGIIKNLIYRLKSHYATNVSNLTVRSCPYPFMPIKLNTSKFSMDPSTTYLLRKNKTIGTIMENPWFIIQTDSSANVKQTGVVIPIFSKRFTPAPVLDYFQHVLFNRDNTIITQSTQSEISNIYESHLVENSVEGYSITAVTLVISTTVASMASSLANGSWFTSMITAAIKWSSFAGLMIHTTVVKDIILNNFDDIYDKMASMEITTNYQYLTKISTFRTSAIRKTSQITRSVDTAVNVLIAIAALKPVSTIKFLTKIGSWMVKKGGLLINKHIQHKRRKNLNNLIKNNYDDLSNQILNSQRLLQEIKDQGEEEDDQSDYNILL